MWVVSEAKALNRKGWTEFPSPCGVWVVSLHPRDRLHQEEVSVPLRGVGCFTCWRSGSQSGAFPSPCGVWVVSPDAEYVADPEKFPSPCGVWVVSAKLHILSGATGKRIVNSAILLYHIGRCLSIAN